MEKDKRSEIIKALEQETIKIVINKCFGGFGISNEALLELIRMKSEIVQKRTIKEYYGKEWEKQYYKDKERLKKFKDNFFGHTFYEGALYDDEFVYFIDDNKNVRINDDLIKVVKKLKEKASSRVAELEIVEVPYGVEWEISEIRGNETVEEKHRSWG